MVLRAGFPAHAGMDLWRSTCGAASRWLPRTRGDGPSMVSSSVDPRAASPHTRGWTRGVARLPGGRRGFPAHAGMDPDPDTRRCRRARLPRTRGDGPDYTGSVTQLNAASPHTRGWTRLARACGEIGDGFPAHAGMDPPSTTPARHRSRLPRTRGDGPITEWMPSWMAWASPHTRGWTRRDGPRTWHQPGFPAHAGMDPPRKRWRQQPRRLPRTRGDGPWRHVAVRPA